MSFAGTSASRIAKGARLIESAAQGMTLCDIATVFPGSSASAFQLGRSIQSGYKRAPNEDSKSVYGLGKETFQQLKAVDRAFSAFP